jgi:hypothetical protein
MAEFCRGTTASGLRSTARILLIRKHPTSVSQAEVTGSSPVPPTNQNKNLDRFLKSAYLEFGTFFCSRGNPSVRLRGDFGGSSGQRRARGALCDGWRRSCAPCGRATAAERISNTPQYPSPRWINRSRLAAPWRPRPSRSALSLGRLTESRLI